jgi:hypothetical protein
MDERGIALPVACRGRWLPPVVDDVGVASAVAGLVGTVHRHALEVPAEAFAGQHSPCAVAAGVPARDEDRRTEVGCQLVTSVDQQAEQALRAGTWPDRAELDVARTSTGLRARAVMAPARSSSPIPDTRVDAEWETGCSGRDIMAVRKRGQNPYFWYRPTCLALWAKVNSPTWRVPQAAKSSIVASSKRCAIA